MFRKNRFLLSILLCIAFINGSISPTRAQNNVTVKVEILKQDKDPNLLPFSLDRPLKIADFKGRPQSASPGVAATFSGIKMGIKAMEQNGQTTVVVTLFSYFKIDKSWMKENGKDQLVLAHEQLHFDLTALQTCKLAHIISSTSFGKNWHDQLLKLHKKYMDELEQLQDQYDRETAHGTITAKQQVYRERVAGALKQQSCY